MKAFFVLIQLIIASTLTMAAVIGVIMVGIEHGFGAAVACTAIVCAPMMILWAHVSEELFPYNEYE